MAANRLTQEAIEVLLAGEGNARLTQEAVEVLLAGDGTARLTQAAVEVLRSTGLWYRSENFVVANSGADITISKPSNTQDGDILIALVHAIATNRTITPPTNASGQPWVQQATVTDGNLDIYRVYTKLALQEPASQTWTQVGGSTSSGWMVDIVAIAGGKGGDFFEQASSRNDAANANGAATDSITAADASAFWVAFFGHRFVNTISITINAPYVERADQSAGTGQMRRVTATHDGGAVTENATGTWSSTATNRKAAIIAVKIGTPRVDTNFIVSTTVVNPPTIVPIIYPDFIASTTVVYTPLLYGAVVAPFIASTTTVFAPTLYDAVVVPFISSTTVVYDLTLSGDATVTVPFIDTTTVVYALTLTHDDTVDVPFIDSETVVFPIFSIYDEDLLGMGTGNGGESFKVLLNANGESDTGTLTADITATSTTLNLSSDSGLPETKQFFFVIDDEEMLIKKVSPGVYRIVQRALGNTAADSHTASTVGTWGDTYNMAITSLVRVSESYPVESETYPGWLIVFDSSQAYSGSSRYPMHVTNFLGVFDSGTGTGGSSKIDSDQPSAVHIPPGISDDCPSGMTIPARISADLDVGDVAVVQYTNPEGTVLELGSRAVAVQAWYGMKRVDDDDIDVTFTDVDGNIVDGTAEEAFENVTFTTTTLPGDDRIFTYGPPRFSESGWPIAALAVRHGRRRIPYWESPTWKDFSYVYSGYFPDATYVQILINRNGIVYGSVPEYMLPGPQDIDGPEATWDDDDYNISTSWYVAIFNGLYLYPGPGLNIIGGPPGEYFIPIVLPPVDLDPPEAQPHTPTIEGGSGGGFQPMQNEGPIDLSRMRFRANT